MSDDLFGGWALGVHESWRDESTIVGHDLGTNAGYVIGRVEGSNVPKRWVTFTQHGVLNLSADDKALGEVGRWLAYRELLRYIGKGVSAFAFENVTSAVHTGGHAARMHGAYRAIMQTTLHDMGVPLLPVSIQAAKRAMTGSGGVRKSLMKLALRKRFGLIDGSAAGDMADAVGVLLAGLQQPVIRS